MHGLVIFTLTCGGATRNMVSTKSCIAAYLYASVWLIYLTFLGDFVRYAPNRLLVNTPSGMKGVSAYW